MILQDLAKQGIGYLLEKERIKADSRLPAAPMTANERFVAQSPNQVAQAQAATPAVDVVAAPPPLPFWRRYAPQIGIGLAVGLGAYLLFRGKGRRK